MATMLNAECRRMERILHTFSDHPCVCWF